MRHRRTGRAQEILEIADVTHCAGCGQSFQPLLFTLTWQQCGCTPGTHGHRIAVCPRNGCTASTYDLPHTGETRAPLEGHRTGPGWYGVQDGPTIDLGDG